MIYNMKYIVVIIILIYSIPLDLIGQGNYYATDSSMTYNALLIDGGDALNFSICQVKKNNIINKYTPYEVKEFGFKNGRVYISKDIQISDSLKRVFLQRLVKGETTLYYYKGKNTKTYFIEKDSNLFIELPKHDNIKESIIFKSNLLNITSDCPNISESINLVSYNKKSLSKLISRYNSGELKPFPSFRYGLLIGSGYKKLVPSKSLESQYVNYLDFKYDGGFTVGLFIDNPILVSDFSLHTELSFSNHGFSYNKLIDNEDIDFVANISSLKLPLLIRYTYPSNMFRPFINLGGVVTFNIKNENLIYVTTITEKIIEINDIKEISLIDRNQAGYSIGGGIEYIINYKNSIFIELRHNNNYGLSDSKSLNISEFKLITGINF